VAGLGLVLGWTLAAGNAVAQQAGAPSITVSQPLKKQIVEWQEFTGQFAPVEYVELRARVGGYLTEIHFTDGQIVNKGDLLFVIVNLARFLKVDPEQALRGTNRKFRERFGYVERKLKEQGRTVAGATLEEMDALWEQAKRNP